MSILINLAAILGISIIITRTAIFERIREFVSTRSYFFGELINCTVCTSFWVGVVFAVITSVWQFPFIAVLCAYIIQIIEDYGGER